MDNKRWCLLTSHGTTTSAETNYAQAEITTLNHHAYAARWGLYHISICRPFFEQAWGFMEDITRLLSCFDYVFTIGADVVITNPEIDLRTFAVPGVDVRVACAEVPELPPHNINCDAILYRNCDAARDFLQAWRATEPKYAGSFCNVQKGFLELMRSGKYAVDVAPPRVMQSHPIINRCTCWQPGDFACHFVYGGEQKVRLLLEAFCNKRIVLWEEHDPKVAHPPRLSAFNVLPPREDYTVWICQPG